MGSYGRGPSALHVGGGRRPDAPDRFPARRLSRLQLDCRPMRWATGSALLFLAASLPAFPEALVFDTTDAVADLRDDGRLDVRETHTISVDEEVQDFTWDVGIAAGQRFELQRLVRVLDDGSERELSQGEPTQTESFYLG